MSLLTNFLKLFKYDPVADKDSTFNITKALNENWDKVDAELKRNSDADAAHKADLASQELNKGASLIGIYDADNKFAATSVEGALKELFINVSDGKQVVATAITGKGVPTSSSDTFGKMATNIDAIETDKTGDATATAADILAPKDAYVKGKKVIGTIPTFQKDGSGVVIGQPFGVNTYEGFVDSWIESAGYLLAGSYFRNLIPNLSPANTKAGVKIGDAPGFMGTFTADATIPDASYLYPGVTAYKNGQKIIGTMPNNGTPDKYLTQQGETWWLPHGYYAGGKVTVSFANLLAGNVKKGINVGGVVGSLEPAPTLPNGPGIKVSGSKFKLVLETTYTITKPANTMCLLAFTADSTRNVKECFAVISSDNKWWGGQTGGLDDLFPWGSIEILSITDTTITLRRTVGYQLEYCSYTLYRV